MKDVRKFTILILLVLSAALASLYGGSQRPPEGKPATTGIGRTASDTSKRTGIEAKLHTDRLQDRQKKQAAPASAPAAGAGASQPAKLPAEAGTTASGQPKTAKIRIDNADLISNNEDIAPGVQTLTGNVRFYHGNTLMTCDQAEYNRGANTFFAQGNVLVNEGDTLTMNSDYMLYTGDDQMIKSYGNVVLVHKTTTLRTDTLDYERQTQKAYYFCGGTIIDDKNTLKSLIGVYRVPDDMVDFFIDVEAWDPDYHMYSDTLHYHTITKVITAEGPTDIYNNDNKIYTEGGQYNTVTGIADFYKNSRVSYGRRMLRGDTLHYERTQGYARAISNVEVQDTAQRAVLYGGVGEYFEKQDSVVFTVNPRAVQLLDKDTLYSRADTMMVTPRRTLVAYQAALAASADSAARAGQPAEEKLPDDTAAQKPVKATGDTTAITAGLQKPGQSVIPADTTVKMSEKQLKRAEKKRLRDEKRATKLKAQDEARAAKTAERGKRSKNDTLNTSSLIPIALPDTTSLASVAPLGGIDSLSAGKAKQDALKPAEASDDSMRVVRAFHNVRFFKRDMSGVADSTMYDQKTGVMSLYGDPAVFSADNQVTADTIYVTRDLVKDVMDSVILVKNAFILSRDPHSFDALYNQVRGNTMRGKIIDNDLRIVHVKGNAETLYYSYDDKEKSIGLNQSSASLLDVYMKNSKVQRIRFNKSPSGVMLSDPKNAPEEVKMLKGFKVREEERPMSPEDIWNGQVEIDLSFAAKPQDAEEKPDAAPATLGGASPQSSSSQIEKTPPAGTTPVPAETTEEK